MAATRGETTRIKKSLAPYPYPPYSARQTAANEYSSVQQQQQQEREIYFRFMTITVFTFFSPLPEEESVGGKGARIKPFGRKDQCAVAGNGASATRCTPNTFAVFARQREMCLDPKTNFMDFNIMCRDTDCLRFNVYVLLRMLSFLIMFLFCKRTEHVFNLYRGGLVYSKPTHNSVTHKNVLVFLDQAPLVNAI